MRTSLRLAVPLAAGALALGMPVAASAQTTASSHGTPTTFAEGFLRPVPTNHSHAFGFATVRLHGRRAHVRVFAYGLVKDVPHAQHFHIQGQGRCPTGRAATDHNGHRTISTVDGQPAYGKIGTSLTTSGDTSPASALAVKRFPTAPHGFESYSRTITVSPAVADEIRDGSAVVVVHGIDYNHNGRYDGVLGPSLLNPNIPLEATAPAACGTLHAFPFARWGGHRHAS